MHQVHLIKFLILAASDLFLQSQLMMIFCLPHTLSLPPIFAVDFCVLVHCHLAARFLDARIV
jgi:hypothetical protein